ncbi:Glucan endo-1,3-beta-glucosidase [Quillaja saponaria]|uniref:Glucan endo-1,3-beta-glucosidase n=1 Tax=Quillaja saponaria TaxID=32244 RepID=A0AAD7PA36_QUISA|nr:Glucan endo-1,3-beta-glucosidase [Quillaja saponaria]
MGAKSPRRLALFSLFIFFSSGASIAVKPPSEAILQNRISGNGLENHVFFPSSVFTTQLDSVPVVNPTTPGTSTFNPSPQGPFGTDPTPTAPTSPTSPTSPTAPTAPTAPTSPTSPTSPTTTPTTQTTTTPTTPTTKTPASAGGSWCIASRTASPTALQVALDYACGFGGADCSAIQTGASCYNPSTLQDHASYAFNNYYQKNPSPTSCVFGGTAQLTNTDPSNGSCRFASSSTQSTSPPITISPPNPMIPTPNPPSPMTPTPATIGSTPSLTIPRGSAIYGSEPTESPNSAISVSNSLLLFFTTIGLWGSIVTKYI